MSCGPQPPSFGLPELLLPAARWGRRQVASCSLEAGLASAAAREFTRQILRAWGLLVVAEDASLIVSELVSNALRHGARGVTGAMQHRIELTLCRRGGLMVCAVTDPGTEPPVLVPLDPCAEAGRGLHVVQALSATWGWARLGGQRKAVWATLRVPCTDADKRPARSVAEPPVPR